MRSNSSAHFALKIHIFTPSPLREWCRDEREQGDQWAAAFVRTEDVTLILTEWFSGSPDAESGYITQLQWGVRKQTPNRSSGFIVASDPFQTNGCMMKPWMLRWSILKKKTTWLTRLLKQFQLIWKTIYVIHLQVSYRAHWVVLRARVLFFSSVSCSQTTAHSSCILRFNKWVMQIKVPLISLQVGNSEG